MTANMMNPRVVAIVATVVCVGSLVWLMSTRSVNTSLEKDLQAVTLRSEALLSEKLLLQKDIEKMREQLASLRGVNADLDRFVSDAELRLAQQEADLKRLSKQNASLTNIARERAKATELKNELERELTALKHSYANLEDQNRKLLIAIDELQDKNVQLAHDLNSVMAAAIREAQVNALRGKKERLTVSARRTNKLVAEFEVPGALGNISFRIVSPKGLSLGDKDGTIVSNVAGQEILTASASEGAVAIPATRKARMEFVPKRKLESGVYKVEVLNDNIHVTTLNVKLR